MTPFHYFFFTKGLLLCHRCIILSTGSALTSHPFKNCKNPPVLSWKQHSLTFRPRDPSLPLLPSVQSGPTAARRNPAEMRATAARDEDPRPVRGCPALSSSFYIVKGAHEWADTHLGFCKT